MIGEASGDAARWAYLETPGISPDLLRIAQAERDADEILSWSPNSIDPLLWQPMFYTSYPDYRGSTADRVAKFDFEKHRGRAVIESSREGHPRALRFVTSLAALQQANMAGAGHGEHIAGISELPGASIHVFEDLSKVWPGQLVGGFRIIGGENDTLAVAEHALGVEITDDPDKIEELTDRFHHLNSMAKPLGEITVPKSVEQVPPSYTDHGPHPTAPGAPGRAVINAPSL